MRISKQAVEIDLDCADLGALGSGCLRDVSPLRRDLKVVPPHRHPTPTHERVNRAQERLLVESEQGLNRPEVWVRLLRRADDKLLKRRNLSAGKNVNAKS